MYIIITYRRYQERRVETACHRYVSPIWNTYGYADRVDVMKTCRFGALRDYRCHYRTVSVCYSINKSYTTCVTDRSTCRRRRQTCRTTCTRCCAAQHCWLRCSCWPPCSRSQPPAAAQTASGEPPAFPSHITQVDSVAKTYRWNDNVTSNQLVAAP